jgi:energy-converting hydrogenase Eha subunit A
MHSEIIHLYCIMTRLIYLICLIDAAILQFPAIHKKKPPRLGYRRTKINRKIYYLCK